MRISPFGHSRDLVARLDRTGQVIWRNPALEARYGDATWPPADAAVGWDAARAKARADQSAGFEWGETSAAGITGWWIAELTPDADGIWCISRDVSELKRSEQRLRRSEQLMVDTQGVAHLGTWEWDVSKPTATWSAELYRIYGLTPETYTPSYEAYLEIVHPDDRQRVIDATNRVFHEHVPYSHDERIRRPDGTWRWLHTWAYPLLDDAGRLTHLIGVCQDITDRRRAEEALQQANAELEERVAERTGALERALRDLESFNSMISHDLRSPLQVMQMATRALEHELAGGSPVTRDAIDRLRRSTLHMGKLVDDLLAFARVGAAAIRPQPLDLSELCREIVSDLQAAAPERQVGIAIAPGLACTADPTLFRVVLSNLIGNAWKYTGQTTGASIQIGGDASEVFVRDNGIGFDMADADRLFAPFERLSNTGDFTGSGIGLATAKRIVTRHGGAITAVGRPGQGATFHVTLPNAPQGA